MSTIYFLVDSLLQEVWYLEGSSFPGTIITIRGFSPPWEFITCPTISQTESITTASAYLNDTWDGKIQGDLQEVKEHCQTSCIPPLHTQAPPPLLYSCTQAFIWQLLFFAQATHKFRQVRIVVLAHQTLHSTTTLLPTWRMLGEERMEQRQISTVNEIKLWILRLPAYWTQWVESPVPHSHFSFSTSAHLSLPVWKCVKEREGGGGSQPLEISTWSGCKGREERNERSARWTTPSRHGARLMHRKWLAHDSFNCTLVTW